MFMSNLIRQLYVVSIFLFLSIISINACAGETTSALKINLGQALSQSEINKYAITITPDGKHLPKGQGSVAQGRKLYNNQCQMCHGENGIEGPAARLAGTNGWISFSDPLRILRIKKYPVLLISVGELWPYATTIFDYIRRAMPHYAPKSLNNDQAYALTAYILYLNGLIEEKIIVDKNSLLEIKMPAHELSVDAWKEESESNKNIRKNNDNDK